jgi:hypothetical protein
VPPPSVSPATVLATAASVGHQPRSVVIPSMVATGGQWRAPASKLVGRLVVSVNKLFGGRETDLVSHYSCRRLWHKSRTTHYCGRHHWHTRAGNVSQVVLPFVKHKLHHCVRLKQTRQLVVTMPHVDSPQACTNGTACLCIKPKHCLPWH